MQSDTHDILLSHPHDFFVHKHLQIIPGSCFVLMPFDHSFTLVYETIVKALDGLMTCTRADDLPIGQPILTRILDGISSAELVIADLTGLNANVFYEVGLAHIRTKNVLLLTQNIDEVPFDLRSLFCHEYSVSSTKGLHNLERVVQSAAKHVRSRGIPTMLKGAIDRTTQIIQYMERYLGPAGNAQGLVIRLQAGFSSIANEGYPEALDEDRRRYGTLLEKERDCLIRLLEKGATLNAIIFPPLGPWDAGRWRRRYDRLLAFLGSRQDLEARAEFVYSVEEGPNLFFFGEEVLFEGHKTGIESGYGWTMVYTEKEYVKTRLTIFDMLFESARRHTLKRYGGETGSLRDAVMYAIRQARDGVNDRWIAGHREGAES